MFNKRESENMETATHSSIQAMQPPQQLKAQYLPLEQVTKPNLKTSEAAYYLNRAAQTLRVWACLENGPIRPKRIHGLLAWSTAEVKAIAGVTA